MKPVCRQIGVALIMGAVIPSIILSMATMTSDEKEAAEITETISMPESSPLVPEETNLQTTPISMRLRDTQGNSEEMDMDDYLVCVVLAEMPAYFEEEALKAQAVVARTYARKAGVTGGKHGDGSVCMNSACCQAYITEEKYLADGGSIESVEKVRSAVQATSGYVLTYEGVLIEATYFSCSGGVTEDAQAVWGTDFPYLRSVESPGEENAAHYTDSVTFTAEGFQNALGVMLSGIPEKWFGPVSYTAGGGVETMVIGNESYRGTELRSLLGLRSTAFAVAVCDDVITITTKGFGHRVGMSQYGADAMAVSGSTYQEILRYYYQGTELTRVEN